MAFKQNAMFLHHFNYDRHEVAWTKFSSTLSLGVLTHTQFTHSALTYEDLFGSKAQIKFLDVIAVLTLVCSEHVNQNLTGMLQG